MVKEVKRVRKQAMGEGGSPSQTKRGKGVSLKCYVYFNKPIQHHIHEGCHLHTH
jgi:hypothetical protein